MGRRPLPPGTVDFHAHILPGVDHGSRNLRVATAQWRLLTEAGLSSVVATPHFYAHEEASVEDFLARRDAAADRLLAAVGEEGPALYLGAEVLVFPGLAELPGLPKLTIGGSRLLLLEMPLGGWSEEHLDAVDRVIDRGLIPLVAHIDRYPICKLGALYDRRYLYQVNLGSLLGLGVIPRYFRRMLRAGAVAALGSDLHGVPKQGYNKHYRAFLRAAKSLPTVNEHTAELLDEATPVKKKED